jgi:hypothetical protein
MNFISGVANPNWSLGRIGKSFQKYQLFGLHFDKNKGKSSKTSKKSHFQSRIGPQKILFEPQVGHPCFIWFEALLKI